MARPKGSVNKVKEVEKVEESSSSSNTIPVVEQSEGTNLNETVAGINAGKVKKFQ